MSADSAYHEAIRYLYGLRPRGIRLGLRRLRRELDRRGHPERGMPCVHVAGTNGKGSTVAMIANILRASGYRTGLFTSPHMHRYVERVRVDGRSVAPSRVARWVRENRQYFESPRAPFLTFFEMTTLFGIETFREMGCEVCVFEVGLGGRLDATRVVESKVSVITQVGFDHMRFLGDSLASIAREKAGIIVPGVPVVLGARAEEVRRVIRRRARQLGSPLVSLGEDFEPWTGAIRLAGEHQKDNAACAAMAAGLLRSAGFTIPHSAIARAIARTSFAGRLEWVRGTPDILLDAAHNEPGARVLADYLATQPRRRTVLLFGVMHDKAYGRILSVLDPWVDDRVYATPGVPRALDAAALVAVRPGKVARSISDAIRQAKRAAGPGGRVVVAGSIFLVSDVRAHLRGILADPLITM